MDIRAEEERAIGVDPGDINRFFRVLEAVRNHLGPGDADLLGAAVMGEINPHPARPAPARAVKKPLIKVISSSHLKSRTGLTNLGKALLSDAKNSKHYRVKIEAFGGRRFDPVTRGLILDSMKWGHHSVVFLGDNDVRHIGTKNEADWLEGETNLLDDLEALYNSLVEQFNRGMKGKVIFVSTLPLGPKYEALKPMAARLDSKLKGMARRSPELIGFADLTWPNALFDQSADIFLRRDQVHLNERGVRKVSTYLNRVIRVLARNCDGRFRFDELTIFQLPEY